jgi:hypothetical protein
VDLVRITARPDAPLSELREQLPTSAALSTLWRTIARLNLTVTRGDCGRRRAREVSAALQSRPQPDRAAVGKTQDLLRAARARTFDQVCDLMRAAIPLFTADDCAKYGRDSGDRVATPQCKTLQGHVRDRSGLAREPCTTDLPRHQRHRHLSVRTEHVSDD